MTRVWCGLLLLLSGCSQEVAEAPEGQASPGEGQRSGSAPVAATVDPQQALYDQSRALTTARRREEAVRLVDALGLTGLEREQMLQAFEQHIQAGNVLSAYRRQSRGIRTRDLVERAERGDGALADALRLANPNVLNDAVRNVLGGARFERYLELRRQRAGRAPRVQDLEVDTASQMITPSLAAKGGDR
jgi:hypothetical protein